MHVNPFFMYEFSILNFLLYHKLQHCSVTLLKEPDLHLTKCCCDILFNIFCYFFIVDFAKRGERGPKEHLHGKTVTGCMRGRVFYFWCES